MGPSLGGGLVHVAPSWVHDGRLGLTVDGQLHDIVLRLAFLGLGAQSVVVDSVYHVEHIVDCGGPAGAGRAGHVFAALAVGALLIELLVCI